MYSSPNSNRGAIGFCVARNNRRTLTRLFLSVIFAICFSNHSLAEWLSASESEIPAQAFVAVENDNGQIFHICRATVEENALPGKLIESSGECLISSAGRVYRARQFDVLVGQNFNWIEQFNGDVPFDALPTGKGKDGKALYSCRGRIDTIQHPGKIRRDSAGCHVPHEGREVKVHWYEVLIGQ